MIARLASLGEGKWLLLLLLVAVLVRLPWAAAMSERSPRFDEAAYTSHAELLCEGRGYVNRGGAKDDYWPVGYPAFLALGYCTLGVSKATGFGLQILLLALTCVMVSMIGERSFNPAVGRAGALLLALYPNYIFYSSLLLTEPLYTFLLVSMTAVLLAGLGSTRRYAAFALAAGLLAGLATLVRPGSLLLPLLVPALYVMQKVPWPRTVLTTLIVVLASMTVISPWMIRNHGVTQPHYEVSANGGLVFWGGNHPDALGGVARPESVARDLAVGTPDYDGRSGYQLGLASITSDVPAAVRRSMQKLSYFLSIETDGAMWNYKGLDGAGRGVFPTILAGLTYILAVASALFALLHGVRNRAFGSWFLLLSAYSAAIVVAFEGDPRYHFPLIPFLLMYSAIGLLEHVPAKLKEFRSGRPLLITGRADIYWLAGMGLFLLLIVINLHLKSLEGVL